MVLVDKIVKLPWFLPATFIFVLSLFIPSIFDIDDLVINMILKGTAIASEPLPYLYYCNYYFGKFLSSLYATFPDIAWYYYWLAGLHYCSDLVLGYFLFRPKKILPVLGYIIYLTTISLNVYLTISYTAVIGISSAAIAVAYFNFVHVKSSWRVGGVLFALLFAASFTRFEPAFIGMAVFALPSLYLRRGDFTELQKGNFSCLKLWLPITLIVVVIPLSTTLASSEKFKESGWTEFREVNKLKQQINDYGRVSDDTSLDEKLAAVDLTRQDLNVFKNWILFDKEISNSQTLSQIVSEWGAPSLNKVLNVSVQFFNSPHFLVVALFLSIIHIALNKHERFLSYLCLTSALLVAMIFVLYFQRATGFVVMAFYASVLALYSMVYAHYSSGRDMSKLALSVTLISLLFIPYYWAKFILLKQEGAVYSYNLFQNLPREQLYVIHSQNFLQVDPRNNLEEFEGLKIMLLGTPSLAPFTDVRLSDFGFSNYYEMLLHSNTRFIGEEERLIQLKRFIERRSGVSTNAVKVNSHEYILVLSSEPS